MNRKADDTLADAIEDIRSGSKSIEEILAKSEANEPDFEHLLRLTLSIKPSGNLELSATKRQLLRSRLMNDIASEELTKRPFASSGIWNFWNPLSTARRIAVPALVIVLVMAVAAGGTVYASQDSLPGDALYGVKLAKEQAQIALALSPDAKVEALLQSAQTRTNEIAREKEQRPHSVESSARHYETDIEQALQIANTMSDDENKERVAARLLDNLERHQARLQEVYEKAPAEAKEAISRAQQTSRHGLETAAAMVEKERSAPGAKSKNRGLPTKFPDAAPAHSTTTPIPPVYTTMPRVPGVGRPDTDDQGQGNDDRGSPGASGKQKPTDVSPRDEPAAPGKGPGGRGR